MRTLRLYCLALLALLTAPSLGCGASQTGTSETNRDPTDNSECVPHAEGERWRPIGDLAARLIQQLYDIQDEHSDDCAATGTAAQNLVEQNTDLLDSFVTLQRETDHAFNYWFHDHYAADLRGLFRPLVMRSRECSELAAVKQINPLFVTPECTPSRHVDK